MSETVAMSDKQFGDLLGKMAENLKPVIEEKAHDAVRDAGLDKIDRKHAMFPGSDKNATGKERSYQFFKAVLGGDVLSVKALSEGVSGAAGGYLVPAGFREEVVARLADDAELAPYVRNVPVRTDTGGIPALATDISVTWTAGGTAENSAMNESTPTLGQVAWSLKRADALTKISRELVADSQPSIVEFITRLFREAISTERDKMIAVGDGSAQPEGISVATGLTDIATIGALDYSALVEVEQSLKMKYRKRSRWIMNGTNLRRIYSLLATNGEPLFKREVVAGIPESRILGYPVSQQDDLDDAEIFFGDLSYYLWFDREEMGIESTNSGGDAFTNHQTWIKVWERADGKVGLPEAFVKGTGITA